MSDAAQRHAPIAIAGGGPVGLMLALFLDRLNVRSVLFNTEETTRWHPKGGTENARTMELFRQLGLARRIRALGLPDDHATDVAYFNRFNGFELARFKMPSRAETLRKVARAPKTDQTPEPIHRANQMHVERFLFKHAHTRPNITLRYGWHVVGFEQDGDGVTIVAESAPGGEREAWRAQYLAGCDGGRSTIRRLLGIRFHGDAVLEERYFGGRMFSTYIRAPALYDGAFLGERRAWQYWVLNPEMCASLVTVNGEGEFLFRSKVDQPHQAPDDASIARVLHRCAGADVPVQAVGHEPWTAGVALVAERFGSGRVVLAGDAVHLFTPTGGFGMNTGIEDTANLAWKLAAAVQGWGGPKLVETYELERKPIALRNTGAALEHTININELQPAAVIEEDSAEGAAARQVMRERLATFAEEFASIGVQLGARYDGSPIIVGDAPPPADDFITYRPTSVPGGRAPHIWLDDDHAEGASLFDRFGPGFTLLCLAGNVAGADRIAAAARARRLPLRVIEIADPDARELYERDLVLVRPDQHVAWRGNRAPDDAEALLARLAGW